MTENHWERLEQLFHSARALPAGRRRAFLEESARGDSALVAEVLGLIAAHDSTNSLLDAPSVAELAPGVRLGQYELERILGSGGMGTVYLAHRADHQFEKRVAIKLVNRGLAAAIMGDRFDRERQILADLEHPNIARLLDAGLSEYGQPYLVMEWVDGVSLDVWTRQNHPTHDECFDLWLKVAEAVSYAHRHLTVHCDLKPSNILVTREGVPKLLDFGVAKLLGQGADTATRTRHFTPLYASPEQIRGAPIGTAADIYSLGIILYELVEGEHPFGSGEDLAGAALTQEVRVPATAPKDLAAILGMALRQEPERRYATVDQFAEDLRRYRKGWPVVAQPETFLYRARKFVGRHRWSVSIAAAVIISMVALTAVALSQARIAARQRARAEKVTGILSEMMGATPTGMVGSLRNKGASLRVVDLVAAVAARLNQSLGDQPEVEASLRYVVGSVDHELGLFPQAEQNAARAVELFHRVSSPGDPQRLNADLLLAHVHMELGRFAEAEGEAGEVARLWKNPPPYTAAAIATALGISQFRLGKVDAAEQTLRKGLAALEAGVGSHNQWVGLLESDLSLVYLERGNFEEALEHLQRAVAQARAQTPGASEPLGWALLNLANVHRFLGHAKETAAYAEEARVQFEAALGDSSPAVAQSLSILSWGQAAAGDHQAELSVRRAVAIERARLPEGHYQRAVGLTFLGFVLMNENKLAESRQALTQALEIRRRNFQAPNWRIAETAGFLGELYARMGDPAKARPLLEESLRTFTTLYGPSNARTREAQARLAKCGG